jgi:hypothetical protein
MLTNSTPPIELADFGLRTVPKTRVPRAASSCAISQPMLNETPVTNAVLFSTVCICTISSLVCRL